MEPSQASGVATILLVEDEDSLRQAVSKMLRKTGITVIEAADGSAALDAIRSAQTIDVLILDITIPGASSREVFSEARRLRPKMKVIVISAYSRDFAAGFLEAPVEQFIRKPYRVNEILELIQPSP